jgi:hypothetical protein
MHISGWGCMIICAIRNCRNDVIFNNIGHLNFCRLYIRLLTGSTCGPFSFPRINMFLWIEHALAGWRLFGLSSARVVDSVLIGYNLQDAQCYLYSFFWWLILVATFGDPWICNNEYFDTWELLINSYVHHSDGEAGISHLRKRHKIFILWSIS